MRTSHSIVIHMVAVVFQVTSFTIVLPLASLDDVAIKKIQHSQPNGLGVENSGTFYTIGMFRKEEGLQIGKWRAHYNERPHIRGVYSCINGRSAAKDKRHK